MVVMDSKNRVFDQQFIFLQGNLENFSKDEKQEPITNGDPH